MESLVCVCTTLELFEQQRSSLSTEHAGCLSHWLEPVSSTHPVTFKFFTCGKQLLAPFLTKPPLLFEPPLPKLETGPRDGSLTYAHVWLGLHCHYKSCPADEYIIALPGL